MKPRLACLAFALATFALWAPRFAAAAGAAPSAPDAVVAECAGDEADASRVAVHFHGKAQDLLRELVRVKHLLVANAELVGDAHVGFEFPCVYVNYLIVALAEESHVQVVREEGDRYRLAKVRNFDAITKLRAEADTARGNDPQSSLQALQRIVALSQPGGPDEPAASVEGEYHELGNLAMEDKDYAAAERFYRARVADLDRTHAAHDTNYGIALSNIADARIYQDDYAGATPMYERALAVLEKQSDLAAPPNAVLILETLSNVALRAKRYAEAEALADRAWKYLSDPQRSEWESGEHALEVAAVAEAELGRLGPKDRSDLHYERALGLYEARYPADATELIAVREKVMFRAARAGKLDRAAAVAEQQMAAAERRGELTSDVYVVALYELLALYARQGKLDRVIALWPRLIEARRALLGANSPHVVAALRQLATLYRINGQWAEAAASEQSAATIMPVDDSKALAKVEFISNYAMQYDPAFSVYCAKFAWPTNEPGLHLRPPPPPPPPPGVLFLYASTSTWPMPTDKPGQARYYEQYAECFSDWPSFAGAAMERALRLRIDVNGAKSSESRRAAERTIAFYQRAGYAEEAERVRTLSGG